ncbi:MAG: DUF6765 family protein, partial [Pseudobdellovibrionaceae bacterium]
MKIFKRIILLSALIFAQAHAYDIDTHFYSTAAVLIKRGVKKEVAYKLAAYAQWIDESGLTTPMTTERKRRLFHFPTPLMLKKVPKPSAQEVSEFLEQMEKQTNEVLAKKGNFKDRVHGKNMGVLAEVIENNPMAYDIMKKGLATGDFVLVGAGIHILMDSYGHSGFTPFEGHAHAGHDPDAPYKHVEKYYRMLQTAFKVTTVLLNALPEEAIDRTATFTDKNGQVRLSAEASADDVYESFINDPDVKRAIEYNIQRSPDYTRVAIGTILASMTQAGIIKDSSILKAIISDEDTFTRGKSTEEIMEEIVGAILAKGQDEASKILDLSELSDDYLREISMHLSIPDYIKNAGGVEAGAKRIALVITRRFVAHNMDANHQFVMDPEGPPREKEMSMRIDAWQNVIQKLTGDRVL